MSVFNRNPSTLSLSRINNHILLLQMNRPDVANALNTQMAIEMKDIFLSLYADLEDIRCIILTGTGKKAFCGGGDLKERNNMTDQEWRYQHAIFEQNIQSLMDCRIPIIAAVNGAAFGGGCEFTVACDFAYASTNARFALPEVTLGILPGTAGTQNLPRAVGIKRAKEIILTGSPFTAEQALEWGMINQLYEPDGLIEKVTAIAEKICKNAPIAIQQAKISINMSNHTDLKTGYAFEIEAYNRTVSTNDRREGISAFNEKRKPDFIGK